MGFSDGRRKSSDGWVSDNCTKGESAEASGLTEVLEEGLLGPGDTLVDVGGSVRESLGLSGLSAAVGERG